MFIYILSYLCMWINSITSLLTLKDKLLKSDVNDSNTSKVSIAKSVGHCSLYDAAPINGVVFCMFIRFVFFIKSNVFFSSKNISLCCVTKYILFLNPNIPEQDLALLLVIFLFFIIDPFSLNSPILYSIMLLLFVTYGTKYVFLIWL